MKMISHTNSFKSLGRLVLVAAAAATLSACNTISQLSQVGDGPELTSIANPTTTPNYRPVSLPMPRPEAPGIVSNSLWRTGSNALFRDHRAKAIGDILTVKLDLNDSAAFANKTTRARDDSESTSLTNLLGLEGEFTKMLPQGLDPNNMINFGNDHSTSGDGAIDRSETLSLTFAAVVTQILPNGSLVVMGSQELMVNSEMRELKVTGVIRPQDIDSDNAVSHERIAEMRVAYGGRGTISGLQQPRWGTQIWDIIFPF